MPINNYTDVKICNLALDMIAGGTIDAIDEESSSDKEATMSRLYRAVSENLLTMHDWNFAKPVRQLAIDADVTTDQKFGYQYAHKLPTDLIAGPFGVFANNDLRRPVTDFVNANGYVFSDYEIIHVHYRAVASVDTWPAYFVTLVATAIAADAARPVVENTELGTEMRIRAFGPAILDGEGGLYRKAKNIDAKGKALISLFRNGNPLSATRY